MMVFLGLLFISVELLFSIHGLQIHDIDLNDFLESVDNYKNVQQRNLNSGKPSSSDDNDDLTRSIQRLEFNNDDRISSLKKYDPLDAYAGDSDYSKLYVILNPKVNLPKSTAKDIAKVISSLFSKYVSYKKSETSDHSKKTRYYKGFAVKANRRRIKESKEKYAMKDSIERDYKPKRGRADYGGGGRTAIPYIRHRGDIYERE